MKLVTFEEPIWSTLQGEGILAGTPSVFIRMYGCDFQCSWCDTKGSWKPGSVFKEYTLEQVVASARAYRLKHAVITGGNPFLHLDQLADLVVALQAEWLDKENGPDDVSTKTGEVVAKHGSWRPGMHVTVETQASIFDESVARLPDLLSLSPKLHDWRDAQVVQFIHCGLVRRRKKVQVKVVVSDVSETQEALERFGYLFRWALSQFNEDKVEENLHFILQPESSTGRKGIEAVRLTLERWMAESGSGFIYPTVRLVPQLHKSAFYVR